MSGHDELSLPKGTRIAYFAMRFPSVSETFVYNEVLMLRKSGVEVVTVSIRRPDSFSDHPMLGKLSREAVQIYGAGSVRFVVDLLSEMFASPFQSVSSLSKVVLDAILSDGLSIKRRCKVLIQGLAGLVAAARLRPQKVSHIHAHMAHVPATVAMYAAVQLGVEFSVTGHAADLFPDRVLLKEKLQRAAFFCCISHWHRRFYKSLVPDLREERLPVVRCGVRIPDLIATSSDVPLILAVGRLVRKKGFRTLIEAVGDIRRSDVKVRIIGDGPQRAELKSFIDSKGLNDRIELFGAADNEEILQQLLRATLFVLPCEVDSERGDRDGIPVALMEAMAAGVCCITSELEPIDELVIGNKTGVLIKQGSASDLSNAINLLLADGALRTNLAESGRCWVRSEFSSEINIERLLDAFSGALASKTA